MYNPATNPTSIFMKPAAKRADTLTSKSYTSGIDESGKAYLYDKSTNKMVYYGAPNQAWHERGEALRNQGYTRQWEGDKSGKSAGTADKATVNNNDTGLNVGGGYTAPAKTLDQAQLDAIMSLLSRYDSDRENAKREAQLKREEAKNKKEREFEREEGKYKGKKLSTLQEFGGAKTETDLNVRNTLENLISSLSTMGLGGSRALTRQILDAANQSNRKANATQATNNQELDSSFNEYKGGYEDDLTKIGDQYKYQTGLADKDWATNRQNALYKMADVYGDVDRTADREKYMKQGNSLNSVISNSAFLDPKYTGEARAMATPELADYTQDIAQYNTAGVGAGVDGMPGNSANTPGNLAIKAVALNDKDYGVKKKTEGDLAYGV